MSNPTPQFSIHPTQSSVYAVDAHADFFAFAYATVSACTQAGQYEVAHNRGAALRSFSRFLCKESLAFTEMDAPLMSEFKLWMLSQGRKEGTAILYMRQLNACYNQAVKQGLAPRNENIHRVAKATRPTASRILLTMDELRTLRSADLSRSKSETLARDLFFFCIYTRGMSFIDLAFLKKSDLKEGTLTYTSRTKGRPVISLPWDEAMQEIVDRHPSKTSLLFPLLTELQAADEKQALIRISQIRQNIKRSLSIMAKRMGCKAEPTLYMPHDLWKMLVDRICVRDLF